MSRVFSSASVNGEGNGEGRSRILGGRRWVWLWLLAYALLTFLSFPQPFSGGVLDLGVPLAWFGPAALLLALRGRTPRQAAKIAFLGAWIAHALVLHWIYVVAVRYGHAAPALGVVATVGIAAVVAAHFALFGALFGWLGRAGLANPFSVALLWTAVEYLRSFLVCGGFPWATLGYTQIRNSALCAIAPVTGVYGVSFVVVLVGAALVELVAVRRWRVASVRVAIGALAFALLLEAGGAFDLARDAAHENEAGESLLGIAALQGNIAQDVKWDQNWAERTWRIYEDLSRRAAREGAQLIVWPETAVPGSVSTDPVLRGELAALARETGAVLVVGGVGIDVKKEGEWRYFDSAFVFDAQGALRERYDKAHLVPFGEYVPLQSFAGRFLKAIARGISLDRVTAGRGPRALQLVDLWGEEASAPRMLRLGVPVCYELVFPDLVRRMVRDGAGVLLGMTNDAWYGRTGAPYQLLAMSAMRSAENRVWSVRAANTGVSAIIDDRGRVVARTPIFEPGMLVRRIPVRSGSTRGSWYSRHGDRFAQACASAVLVLALFAYFRPARVAAELGDLGDE